MNAPKRINDIYSVILSAFRQGRYRQFGFAQVLPLLLLAVLGVTTFVIIARIQQERTGELRQFASGKDPYVTPEPAKAPTLPPPPPGGGGGCGGFREGAVAVGGEAYDAGGGRQARRRCEYDPALGYSVWKQCPDCPLTIIPSDSVDTQKYKDEAAAYQSQQSLFLDCLSKGGSNSECMSKVADAVGSGTNYLVTREGQAWTGQEAKQELEKQEKMQEYLDLQDRLNSCIESNNSSQGCSALESQLSAARSTLLTLGFTDAQIQAQTKSNIISQQATSAVLQYLAADKAYQDCLGGESRPTRGCSALKARVDTFKAAAEQALVRAGLDEQKARENYIHELYLSQIAADYAQKEAAAAACTSREVRSGESKQPGVCLTEFSALQQVLNKANLTQAEEQQIRVSGLQSYDYYKAMFKTDEELIVSLCKGKTSCDVDKELMTYLRKQSPSMTIQQVQESVQDRRAQITKQENDFKTYRDYLAASSSDEELAKQCPSCRTEKEKENYLVRKRNELPVEYRKLADTEIKQAIQTIVDAHPGSNYEEAYQSFKAEQMSDERRFVIQNKSEDQLRKEFDTANQEALATMAPIWEAAGSYELNYARWQRGEISPLELKQNYVEQTKGWEVDVPILGPVGKVIWDSFGWEDPGAWHIDISPKKWAYDTFTFTLDTLKDVIPTRPDWMVKNQTEGQLALLADTPAAKNGYLESIGDSANGKKWMKDHDTTDPDDYLTHQLEGYYKNEGYFEQQGLSQDTDAGQIYFDKILRGEVDIDQEISRRGLDKTSTQIMGTVFFGAMKVFDTGLKIVTLGNENSFQQLVMPNLTTWQQHNNADLVVGAITPQALKEREAQALQDPQEHTLFEEWKTKQPKGEDTTFKSYLTDAYAQALDITDLGQIGNYKLDGAKELFTSDPNWLTRAVLQGTIGTDDLSVLNETFIEQDKRVRFIQSTATVDAYIQSDPELSQLPAKTQQDLQKLRGQAYDKLVIVAKQEEAEAIAKLYLKSMDPEFRSQFDEAVAAKLTSIGSTESIEEYQARQVAAYLADTDVALLMRSGSGTNVTLEGALDGSLDIARASQALQDIKLHNPAAALALGVNKFTEGSYLAGYQLMSDSDSNFIDKSRGFFMMTAKPVGAALAFAIPWIRVAQIGTAAISAQTTLAITGEALGVQMTGTSFQDTARNCTLRNDMNTGACLTSFGMTAFAGWSALSSMQAVNTITRAAMISEGRSVGAVSEWLAKSRASILVSPGDKAVIQAAALRTGALPATAENIALVESAVATAFTSKVPNVMAERARNLLGTAVFGSQAAQTCSSTGVNGDCLLSVGLAGISFARMLLPTEIIANPTSQASKTIMRGDQIVNSGLAVAACAAAAAGDANWDYCVTAGMMAGMTFGHEAIARTQQGEGAKLLTPFQEKALVLSDLAKIDGLKDFTNLNSTTLSSGETVRFGESAAARASVLERLALATVESGKTIAQANALLTEFNKLPTKELTVAEREALVARDAWKGLLTETGQFKSGLNPQQIDAARAALTQASEKLTYERTIVTDPRTNTEKARDAIARIFGREPKVILEFNAAKDAFTKAITDTSVTTIEYEVARQNLEKARTEVQRTGVTRAQQEYARQLDIAKEELARVQDEGSLIRLRIDLLENPTLIAEARTRQQVVVGEASKTLSDLISRNADTQVIDVASKGLTRAQDVLASIDQAASQNSLITNEALRFTVIANETVKLSPSIASERQLTQQIQVLEQSITVGSTLGGRVNEFANQLLRGQSTAERVAEQLKPKPGVELVRKIESTAKSLASHDVTEAKVTAEKVTENGKEIVRWEAKNADKAIRDYVEKANTRLQRVQEELEFPLYTKDTVGAPQDQARNILEAATRGDHSMWLVVPGGGGKTETAAITASERFHYTGRKQVMVVESEETIKNNRGTAENPGVYEKIFEAEGVKRYYLTDRVSNLPPEEFAKLMEADVIVTTNKISYEFITEYGKGSAHPEFQTQFTDGLQSGKGFEFIVDEAKTIWQPALSFQVSGDTAVYATTAQGQRDVAILQKALGWRIDANGVIIHDPAATGPLVKLQQEALRLLDRGAGGLRELFDPTMIAKNGDLILRQDIRAEAYRELLLEQARLHPEARGNIDAILGEFRSADAFARALSDPSKIIALDAFEQRVNGIRDVNFSRDPLMASIRDSMLEQVGVMETLGKVYSDVVGNSYEPVARLGVDAQGKPIETLTVVPKDRNIFEGKQISDGMQNLVYNSVGKELYAKVSGNDAIRSNINDVQMSQDAHSITILEVSSYAKTTQGMSLEANEVARVWSGAVPDAKTIGSENAVRDMMYGSYSQDGVFTSPKRPLSAIHEVLGVGDVARLLKTRAQAQIDGQAGVMGVNASNNAASNIEVRNEFLRQYGDAQMQLVRNRNDLHQIEAVTGEPVIRADGSRDLTVKRLRVEPIEVNGQMQFRLFEDSVLRTVDAQGRTVDAITALSRVVIDAQATSPLTLTDMDALKLFARGGSLTAQQAESIAKVRGYGLEPKTGFYTDFYDKGADIGINPLSYANESLRVFGDMQNSSSEWMQAIIRARGNEGGTKPVYSEFSQDAALVIIGERARDLTLTEFKDIAESNGAIAVQKQGTQTRLQFLNEFMAGKIREITSHLPEGEARTQAESILSSGQKRLNVRIGAVEVPTVEELARQARIVQETIDQVINMPDVQKLAKGGFMGFGRNVELSRLVNTLTRANGRSIASQLSESLDFSLKPGDPVVIGPQPPDGNEGGFLRIRLPAQEAKPYTEGKSVLEVVRLMEAHSYINPADALAGNVLPTVIRGINEVKTSFTATNTPQDIARSSRVALDAARDSVAIAQRVNSGRGVSVTDRYVLTLGADSLQKVTEQIRTLEARRAALPILTQTILGNGTLRVGDVVVGRAENGITGALTIRSGAVISWVAADGKADQVTVATDRSVIALPSEIRQFRISIDGYDADIELPDDGLPIRSDTTKTAQEFDKFNILDKEIAQQTKVLEEIVGSGVNIDDLTRAVDADTKQRIVEQVKQLGLQSIVSGAQYEVLVAALKAYDLAVARIVSELNSRSLEGNPVTLIDRRTEAEKAALLRAMNAFLVTNADKIKDVKLSKAFTNLGIAENANLNQTLSFSDGGSVRVVNEEHKQVLIDAAKESTIQTLTSTVDSLTRQYVNNALSFQKRQINRVIAAENPNIFQRFAGGIGNIFSGISRMPAAFTNAFLRVPLEYVARVRTPQTTTTREGQSALDIFFGIDPFSPESLRLAYQWTLGVNPFKLFSLRSIPVSERIGEPIVWGVLRIAPLSTPAWPFGAIQLTYDAVRLFSWSVRALVQVPLVRNLIIGKPIVNLMMNPTPGPVGKVAKSILTNATIQNILAGSTDGFLESYVNAKPFGTPGTGFVRRLHETFTWAVRFPLFGWYDTMRVIRWYTQRVNSIADNDMPLRQLTVTPPNYWGTEGFLNRLIPRAIVNATPRNNFLGFFFTRVAPTLLTFPFYLAPAGTGAVLGPLSTAAVAAASDVLWHYDRHRFIFEGGWRSWNFLDASKGRIAFWAPWKGAVDPAQAPSARVSGPTTPSTPVIDLRGYTLVGVVLPADMGQGIGVPVTAQYKNSAGQTLEIQGIIRSNGISAATWNISLEGIRELLTINETQFIPTTVYVAGPAGGLAKGDVDALVSGLFGTGGIAAQFINSAELNPSQCSDCIDFVETVLMPLLAKAQQARVSGDLQEAIRLLDQVLIEADQHEHNHTPDSGHPDAGKPVNTILFDMVRYITNHKKTDLLTASDQQEAARQARSASRDARSRAMTAARVELQGGSAAQANEVFTFLQNQRKADFAAILTMTDALLAQQALNDLMTEITGRSGNAVSRALDAAADFLLRNDPLAEYEQDIEMAHIRIEELKKPTTNSFGAAQDLFGAAEDAVGESLDCTNCLLFMRSLRQLFTRARLSPFLFGVSTARKLQLIDESLSTAQSLIDDHERTNLVVQNTAISELETFRALLAQDVPEYGQLVGERYQFAKAVDEIGVAIAQISKDRQSLTTNTIFTSSERSQADAKLRKLAQSLSQLQQLLQDEIDELDSQRLDAAKTNSVRSINSATVTVDMLQPFYVSALQETPRSVIGRIRGDADGGSRADAWVVGSDDYPEVLILRTRSSGLVTIKVNKNINLAKRPDIQEAIRVGLTTVYTANQEPLAFTKQTEQEIIPHIVGGQQDKFVVADDKAIFAGPLDTVEVFIQVRDDVRSHIGLFLETNAHEVMGANERAYETDRIVDIIAESMTDQARITRPQITGDPQYHPVIRQFAEQRATPIFTALDAWLRPSDTVQQGIEAHIRAAVTKAIQQDHNFISWGRVKELLPSTLFIGTNDLIPSTTLDYFGQIIYETTLETLLPQIIQTYIAPSANGYRLQYGIRTVDLPIQNNQVSTWRSLSTNLPSTPQGRDDDLYVAVIQRSVAGEQVRFLYVSHGANQVAQVELATPKQTPNAIQTLGANFLRRLRSVGIVAGTIATALVIVTYLWMQFQALSPVRTPPPMPPTAVVQQVQVLPQSPFGQPATIESAPQLGAAPTEIQPLDATKVLNTQFKSGIQNPHFVSVSGQDPYTIIPDWFYKQILPNLDLFCSGSACVQQLNVLPLADRDGLQLQLNKDYVPSDLVNIANEGLPTYRSDTLLRATAVPNIKGFIHDLESLGYKVVIHAGYRSYSEQIGLHDQNPVGAAAAGMSMHQSGIAFDIYLQYPDGTINVNKTIPHDGSVLELAHKYGIVHPVSWDDPHWVALDAVNPGLTQTLIDQNIDPDDKDILKQVFLGMAQTFEFEAQRGPTTANELEAQSSEGSAVDQLKATQFTSGISNPHFLTTDGSNPYALIPSWFYDKIAPNLDETCSGAACITQFRQVAVGGVIGGPVQFSPLYKPDNLIDISNTLGIPALTKYDKLQASGVPYFTAFIQDLKQNGYGNIIIRSAYRPYDLQQQYYEQGKDTELVAPAGFSEHQSGLAFDIWVTDEKGNLLHALSDPKVLEIAHRHGIVQPYGDEDAEHYFILDAVASNLTQMMLSEGIVVDDINNVNGVMLGVAQMLDAQAAQTAVAPTQPAVTEMMIVPMNTALPAQFVGSRNFALSQNGPNGTKEFTDHDEWLIVSPEDLPSWGTNRNPDDYFKTINYFNVATSARYKKSGGTTYCNVFVSDVTRALGVEIPRWIDGQKTYANMLFVWFQGAQASQLGWQEVTVQDAQSWANKGYPVVAAWQNASGPGHVAMVIPGELDEHGYPMTAQAGKTNFVGQSAWVGFDIEAHPERKIKYFVNTGLYQLVQLGIERSSSGQSNTAPLLMPLSGAIVQSVVTNIIVPLYVGIPGLPSTLTTWWNAIRAPGTWSYALDTLRSWVPAPETILNSPILRWATPFFARFGLGVVPAAPETPPEVPRLATETDIAAVRREEEGEVASQVIDVFLQTHPELTSQKGTLLSTLTSHSVLGFLTDRFYDPLHQKALPPITRDMFPKDARRLVDEALLTTLEHANGVPQPVLSAPALPFALAKMPWHVVGEIDMEKLSSVNKVMQGTPTPKLLGDYALKLMGSRFLAEFDSEHFRLVRTKGDKYAIVTDTDISADETNTRVDKALNGVPMLYREGNRLEKRPLRFHFAPITQVTVDGEEVAAAEKTTMEVIFDGDEVYGPIARSVYTSKHQLLDTIHTDIEHMVGTPIAFSQFLTQLTTAMLIDDVLDLRAAQLQIELGKDNPDRTIELLPFADREDLIRSSEREEAQEYRVTRINFARMLKNVITDHDDAVADEVIQTVYEHIIRYLTAQPMVVENWRRALEFYVVEDPETAVQPEELRAALTEVLGGVITSQGEDYFALPLVTTTTVTFEGRDVDGAHERNYTQFNRVLTDLDALEDEDLRRQILTQFSQKDGRPRVDVPVVGWEYLRRLFDPNDTRGAALLVQYDATPADIAALTRLMPKSELTNEEQVRAVAAWQQRLIDILASRRRPWWQNAMEWVRGLYARPEVRQGEHETEEETRVPLPTPPAAQPDTSQPRMSREQAQALLDSTVNTSWLDQYMGDRIRQSSIGGDKIGYVQGERLYQWQSYFDLFNELEQISGTNVATSLILDSRVYPTNGATDEYIEISRGAEGLDIHYFFNAEQANKLQEAGFDPYKNSIRLWSFGTSIDAQFREINSMVSILHEDTVYDIAAALDRIIAQNEQAYTTMLASPNAQAGLDHINQLLTYIDSTLPTLPTVTNPSPEVLKAQKAMEVKFRNLLVQEFARSRTELQSEFVSDFASVFASYQALVQRYLTDGVLINVGPKKIFDEESQNPQRNFYSIVGTNDPYFSRGSVQGKGGFQVRLNMAKMANQTTFAVNDTGDPQNFVDVPHDIDYPHIVFLASMRYLAPFYTRQFELYRSAHYSFEYLEGIMSPQVIPRDVIERVVWLEPRTADQLRSDAEEFSEDKIYLEKADGIVVALKGLTDAEIDQIARDVALKSEEEESSFIEDVPWWAQVVDRVRSFFTNLLPKPQGTPIEQETEEETRTPLPTPPVSSQIQYAPDIEGRRVKAKGQITRETQLELNFSQQRWENTGDYSKHTVFRAFEDWIVREERKDPYQLLGVEQTLEQQIRAVITKKEQENDSTPVVVVDFGGMFSLSWLRFAESMRPLVESGRVVFITTNISYDLDQAQKDLEAVLAEYRSKSLPDDDAKKSVEERLAMLKKSKNLVHSLHTTAEKLENESVLLPNGQLYSLNGTIDLLHESYALAHGMINDEDLPRLGRLLSKYGTFFYQSFVVLNSDGVWYSDPNDFSDFDKLRQQANVVGMENLERIGLKRPSFSKDLTYAIFAAPNAPGIAKGDEFLGIQGEQGVEPNNIQQTVTFLGRISDVFTKRIPITGTPEQKLQAVDRYYKIMRALALIGSIGVAVGAAAAVIFKWVTPFFAAAIEPWLVQWSQSGAPALQRFAVGMWISNWRLFISFILGSAVTLPVLLPKLIGAEFYRNDLFLSGYYLEQLKRGVSVASSSFIHATTLYDATHMLYGMPLIEARRSIDAFQISNPDAYNAVIEQANRLLPLQARWKALWPIDKRRNTLPWATGEDMAALAYMERFRSFPGRTSTNPESNKQMYVWGLIRRRQDIAALMPYIAKAEQSYRAVFAHYFPNLFFSDPLINTPAFLRIMFLTSKEMAFYRPDRKAEDFGRFHHEDRLITIREQHNNDIEVQSTVNHELAHAWALQSGYNWAQDDYMVFVEGGATLWQYLMSQEQGVSEEDALATNSYLMEFFIVDRLKDEIMSRGATEKEAIGTLLQAQRQGITMVPELQRRTAITTYLSPAEETRIIQVARGAFTRAYQKVKQSKADVVNKALFSQPATPDESGVSIFNRLGQPFVDQGKRAIEWVRRLFVRPAVQQEEQETQDETRAPLPTPRIDQLSSPQEVYIGSGQHATNPFVVPQERLIGQFAPDHAIVRIIGNTLEIHNLAQFGTWINGQKLEVNERRTLLFGDEVVFGQDPLDPEEQQIWRYSVDMDEQGRVVLPRVTPADPTGTATIALPVSFPEGAMENEARQAAIFRSRDTFRLAAILGTPTQSDERILIAYDSPSGSRATLEIKPTTSVRNILDKLPKQTQIFRIYRGQPGKYRLVGTMDRRAGDWISVRGLMGNAAFVVEKQVPEPAE